MPRLTTLEVGELTAGRSNVTASVGSDESGQVASGEGLYAQVKLWLEAVARSWWTFVPDEALPMMLPGLIGGLARAELEEWDELLDAAE